MKTKTKRGGKRAGSGRRKGTPNKIGRDIRAIAQTYTAEAIETLVGVMRDAKAPAQARTMAADRLLDRAWGKPAQTIAGDPDNPLHLASRIELVIIDPMGTK